MLLKNGANFTSAYYTQLPTVTAVGHSICMSGAMRAVSGIVENNWFDGEEDKIVTSVCDGAVPPSVASRKRKARSVRMATPLRPIVCWSPQLSDELRNAHEASTEPPNGSSGPVLTEILQ